MIVEEAMIDVIVKEIVNEVLSRLKNIPKRALVIFTGGSIGFKESMENLKKLKEEGWAFKVILSRSAESVLTKDLIEKMIGSQEIEIDVESDSRETKYYCAHIDKVIIPVLTMNTVAKMAVGIADTPITNIISHCLMTNIPIVAAKNACDPLDEVRMSMGMGKSSEEYIKMRQNHLRSIENYGVKLVSANELYDFIVQRKEAHTNRTKVIFEKKVLTRVNVVDAFNNNKDLMVSCKTIITAAAKDTARDLGIKITMK